MLKQGLTYFAYAIGSYTEGADPTYSSGAHVEGMIKANLSLNRAGMTQDADNALYASQNNVTGGTLSIEMAGLTKADIAALNGYTVKSGSTGKGYDVTDADAPYVGCGYVVSQFDKKNNKTVHTLYLYDKVQFTLSTDEANTRASSGGSFTTETLDGTILGHKNATGMHFISTMEYDTEDTAIAALNSALKITT